MICRPEPCKPKHQHTALRKNKWKLNTTHDCKVKAEKLGLYTEEILKAQYPHMGSSVASLLNGRHTENACIQRARLLGLSRPAEERMWSENELKLLKENYPLLGRRTAKLLPGRTETACGGMAKKLGLTKKGRAPSDKAPWTEDEIRILRDNYPKSGVLGVQKLLPNRSSTACSNMAIRLGLTAKQSKEEIT